MFLPITTFILFVGGCFLGWCIGGLVFTIIAPNLARRFKFKRGKPVLAWLPYDMFRIVMSWPSLVPKAKRKPRK